MFRTLIALAALFTPLWAQQQTLAVGVPSNSLFTLAAANTIQGVAGTTTAVTYTIFGTTVLGGTATAQVLAQGQLATSVGALYTVAASTTAYVTSIHLANTTGTAVSGVILYVNGTTAAYQITGSITIPANGTAIINVPAGFQVLDALGNLQATNTAVAFSSTAPGVTTPLALSAAGVATTAARLDHTHQSPGGIYSITSSATITYSDTSVVIAVLPANFITTGTTFRFRVTGTGTTSTSPGNDTFEIRIGTSATCTTDTQVTSLAVAANASVTAQPFFVEGFLTARSTTAAIGEIVVNSGGLFTSAVAASVTTSTSVIAATSINYICLNAVSGTSTSSMLFQIGEIVVEKM